MGFLPISVHRKEDNARHAKTYDDDDGAVMMTMAIAAMIAFGMIYGWFILLFGKGRFMLFINCFAVVEIVKNNEGVRLIKCIQCMLQIDGQMVVRVAYLEKLFALAV